MQLSRDLQEKEFKQPNVYFGSGLVRGPQVSFTGPGYALRMF